MKGRGNVNGGGVPDVRGTVPTPLTFLTEPDKYILAINLYKTLCVCIDKLAPATPRHTYCCCVLVVSCEWPRSMSYCFVINIV